MKKRWLPKTPWLRAEMIAAKAALSKWYRIDDHGAARGDPSVNNLPEWIRNRTERTRTEFKDWSLYAAALGQKRGLLPHDLSAWQTEVKYSGGDIVVNFYCQGIAFYKPKGRRKALNMPISIPLQNMFWIPDPVIETTEEVMV